MARQAERAEVRLGKRVIAIDTALYWHALRQSGITDQIKGFGSLFTK